MSVHLPYIKRTGRAKTPGPEERTMQTSLPPAPETGRAARLEARVTPEQKAMLQQAAVLSGRTLSEFVVASAQEAAERVIQEHETIRLSRAEQIAFVTTLLDPPAPGERLRQAAATYRQQMGL